MRSVLRSFMTPLVLAVAVVASGVWIVVARHESNRLFSELENLNLERDQLLDDWGRLQLEMGTAAEHSRIEKMARDELGMSEAREMIVIDGGLR